MASSFNVTGLSEYVKTRLDVLIKDVVLGGVSGDTIPNLAKQFGVKTKERINYLSYEPVLQNGEGCGFSAQGATNIVDRDIETAIFKINDEWCNDDLLGKFAEYLVRFGANGNAEGEFAFEAEILDQLIAGINKQMEKMVWQGATSGTVSGGTDLIDGFITLAENEDSASTIAVSIASGASTYEAIKAVVMQIPEEILDKAVVFVAPAIYRAFIQEMVEKNYYHYESGKIENEDMVFPGTNVRVHKTFGLTGDKRHIYASCYDNMLYAADMMNDKEEVRVWFSDDDDIFKVKVKYNAGVATIYPDEVVLGTAAADLV